MSKHLHAIKVSTNTRYFTYEDVHALVEHQSLQVHISMTNNDQKSYY